LAAKNLKKELEKIVPEKVIKVLYLCSQAAEKSSRKIFLIGGAVRDILTGKNHFDTDITVQGNAVEFAYFLEKIYPEFCKIKEVHESFGTVKIIFVVNNEEIVLDIASSRKEFYPYPGSLPGIEEIGCELYEDVIRRDFTVNSMALSLNKETFGDLTDYLGGYEDIKQKKIRVLHEKSFMDDPTRILRALKFRVRFGYELDEATKQLQENCLESGIFDNFCGERIKSELKQTFNLNKSEIMEIFLNENIYRLVAEEIQTYCRHCEQSKAIQNLLNDWIASSQVPRNDKTFSEPFEGINSDFVWLIYLGVMFSEFSQDKIKQIAEKLYLSNQETEILTKSKFLLEKPELKERQTNFEVYEFFEGFLPESILILLIIKPQLKEKAVLYFQKLKDIKIYTTGQTLIDLGLKPSPDFGEILRKLLKARINEEFFSEEEEKEFLKNGF